MTEDRGHVFFILPGLIWVSLIWVNPGIYLAILFTKQVKNSPHFVQFVWRLECPCWEIVLDEIR